MLFKFNGQVRGRGASLRVGASIKGSLVRNVLWGEYC